MILELHDDEPPTLCARIGSLDYMYQAEQWVIDTVVDHKETTKWFLFDDAGTPIRAWHRVSPTEFEECKIPPGTRMTTKQERDALLAARREREALEKAKASE